jgi:hypothetical protein
VARASSISSFTANTGATAPKMHTQTVHSFANPKTDDGCVIVARTLFHSDTVLGKIEPRQAGAKRKLKLIRMCFPIYAVVSQGALIKMYHHWSLTAAQFISV